MAGHTSTTRNQLARYHRQLLGNEICAFLHSCIIPNWYVCGSSQVLSRRSRVSWLACCATQLIPPIPRSQETASRGETSSGQSRVSNRSFYTKPSSLASVKAKIGNLPSVKGFYPPPSYSKMSGGGRLKENVQRSRMSNRSFYTKTY